MKTGFLFTGLRRLLKESKAVSALEYAILAGVVTLGVSAGVAAFSDNVRDTVKSIGTNVQGEQEGKGN